MCKLLESYVSQVIVWSVWFLLSHRIVSLSLFVNVLIYLGVLVNPMLSALLQVCRKCLSRRGAEWISTHFLLLILSPISWI